MIGSFFFVTAIGHVAFAIRLDMVDVAIDLVAGRWD